LSQYTSMLCSSRWYLILFFSYGFPSVIAPAFSTPAFSAPPSAAVVMCNTYIYYYFGHLLVKA